MQEKRIAGIDIGTSNSATATIDKNGNSITVPNSEGLDLTKSVIGFQKDGTMLVGEEAHNQALANPETTFRTFKLKLDSAEVLYTSPSGKSYTAKDLVAALLTKLKQDAEQALGGEVTDIVLTVPAQFRDDCKQALLDAAAQAGFKNVKRLLPESTAAGIAYGLHNSKSLTVFVFDIGGGTSDLSVMECENENIAVRGTNGVEFGGDKVTEIIERDVETGLTQATGFTPKKDEHAAFFQHLRDCSEQAKLSLSVRDQTQVTVSANGEFHTERITRSELVEKVQPYFDKIIETSRSLLQQCDLSWDDIDKILLVGGGSKTVGMKDAIEAECGKKVSQDIHPLHAVVFGAAIQAASLAANEAGKYIQDGRVLTAPVISVKDVTIHNIGVMIDETIIGREQINAVIIPRHTPIPCEHEDVFRLQFPDQTEASIQILQGEEGAKVSECLVIGEVKLSGLPVDATMPKRIRVRYSIDANGMCTAEGEDLLSARTKSIDFDYSKGVNKAAA